MNPPSEVERVVGGLVSCGFVLIQKEPKRSRTKNAITALPYTPPAFGSASAQMFMR
jgi:hypothetical protein